MAATSVSVMSRRRLRGAVSMRRPRRSAPACRAVCGVSKIASARPCSTTLPSRITMTSLASARTTLRSWLMKR